MLMRFRLSTFDRVEDFTTTCAYERPVDDAHANKVLVTLEPSFPEGVFAGLGLARVTQLVLAPRHRGVTLVPQPSELPCHVHMCVPIEGGSWTHGPYRILEWGVLDATHAGSS